MRQLKITNRITNREEFTLDKYLNEVGKMDLLTPEQESELAKRIKLGDEEALNKLVKANLRFVISVAKQYQNQGLSLNDLINEGNVGLLRAAKRFDETKGFKFITYAVWWIRQTILQAIVEYSRIIRLPYNKVNLYRKIHEVGQLFNQEFERDPSVEEIADILGLSPDEISAMKESGSKHVSIDEPIGENNDDMSLLNMVQALDEESPDLKLLHESRVQELNIAMSSLSPREREILIAFFGLNGEVAKSNEEISDMYNLSTERVRQLRERALLRLKKSFERLNIKPLQ